MKHKDIIKSKYDKRMKNIFLADIKKENKLNELAHESHKYNSNIKKGKLPQRIVKFREYWRKEIELNHEDIKTGRSRRIRATNSNNFVISFMKSLVGTFIFQGKLIKSYNMVTNAIKLAKKTYKISSKVVLRRVASVLRLYFVKKIRYRGRKKYWISVVPKDWRSESHRVCLNLKRHAITEGKSFTIKDKLAEEILKVLKLRRSKIIENMKKKKLNRLKNIQKNYKGKKKLALDKEIFNSRRSFLINKYYRSKSKYAQLSQKKRVRFSRYAKKNK